MTQEMRENRNNTVIKISNLLMPRNDYIGYVKEELEIASDVNPNEANMIIHEEPLSAPQVIDIGLDPIQIRMKGLKTVGINTDINPLINMINSKSSLSGDHLGMVPVNRSLNKSQNAKSENKLSRKRKKSKSKDRYENPLKVSQNIGSPTSHGNRKSPKMPSIR